MDKEILDSLNKLCKVNEKLIRDYEALVKSYQELTIEYNNFINKIIEKTDDKSDRIYYDDEKALRKVKKSIGVL